MLNTMTEQRWSTGGVVGERREVPNLRHRNITVEQTMVSPRKHLAESQETCAKTGLGQVT